MVSTEPSREWLERTSTILDDGDDLDEEPDLELQLWEPETADGEPIDWDEVGLAERPASEIAEELGVDIEVVRAERRARGIKRTKDLVHRANLREQRSLMRVEYRAQPWEFEDSPRTRKYALGYEPVRGLAAGPVDVDAVLAVVRRMGFATATHVARALNREKCDVRYTIGEAMKRGVLVIDHVKRNQEKVYRPGGTPA